MLSTSTDTLWLADFAQVCVNFLMQFMFSVGFFILLFTTLKASIMKHI